MNGQELLPVASPAPHELRADLLELGKLGRAYDEAMRRASIARAKLSEDRNRLDGEVYEARKAFTAQLDKVTARTMEAPRL